MGDRESIEALVAENQKLRDQLEVLIQQARENEKISQRMQASELRILSADTFSDVASVIVDELQRDDLIITLVLADPEFEVARMIESEQSVECQNTILPYPSVEILQSRFSSSFEPCFELPDETQRALLFPGCNEGLVSTLLMPLVREGKLVGSLNFGSMQPDHYRRGVGTELIQRLSAIIAVALQQILNRARLRHAGLTDPLTQLNNRRFFEQRLVEEFDRARRTRRPLCCLMIDVDHFKSINDEYGHQGGDAVLQTVARTMDRFMRSSDVLARYGGEEFVVLLPETPARIAKDVAQRLRSGIEKEPTKTGGRSLTVTVSIGLSLYGPDSSDQENPRTLVAYADQALYRAKQNGRNRVETAPGI